MVQRLPIALENEPLVEAVFEIRFQLAESLADILPGFLLHELKPRPKITRLPPADMPKPIRDNDPGLRFAPTQKIELEKFVILVGDRNVVLSCKLPYPKWATFKSFIAEIMEKISQLELSLTVNRYSIKYVNIVPASTIAEQIKKVRVNLTLGDIDLKDEHFQLRLQKVEEDTVHFLTVAAGAEAKLSTGKNVVGIIVDIDSIRENLSISLSDFQAELPDRVERLRLANKIKFFSCITEEALEEMGPLYE